MADFIGLTVLATLSDPSDTKVRGLVTDAVAGQLTLILWLPSGVQSETLVLDASNIIGINVVPEARLPDSSEENKQAFVDPAIVSYGRPEDAQVNGNSPPKPTVPLLAHTSTTEQIHEDLPNTSSVVEAPIHKEEAVERESGPGMLPPDKDSSQHLTPRSTRRRNGKRRGWRQTPLLEETNMSSPQILPTHQGLSLVSEPQFKAPPTRYTKPTAAYPKGRRQRYREEEQNGWATGEATDIQDMGDFNFQENLSKFDKRKVFDQIRQEDTTADEARLVSFNRLPAPRAGTAGGKNLHYTENVLDSPEGVGHSSGDSEIDISEAKISSGRSSHRNMSRTSTRSIKKVPSRKGSAIAADDQYGPSLSFIPETVGRVRRAPQDQAERLKTKMDSSHSRYRKSKTNMLKPSLRFKSSKRTCPCVTPLQMLELEQLAMSELGLTEDMITENAAQGIAETSLHIAITDVKERDPGGHSIAPLVVILAGNNKTGSRAVAAGRHLRNHGARVVLCVLGLEREDELFDSVRRQLKIFRNCGGQAIKQDGLMRTLRKLQAPTTLIVDALLGMHVSFDDLRTDDQAAYFQLVCWANGSDAATLAIDVPSGFDASSGETEAQVLPLFLLNNTRGLATIHDETELVLHAGYVLSLGAPKTGLLSAVSNFEEPAKISLLVADIGISNSAWKKFGTKRRYGVDFGEDWVATLQYQDGTEFSTRMERNAAPGWEEMIS